ERRVYRGDGAHRHRATPPVGALVEVLPGVLDAPRIATDEERQQVVVQVARDGELAAVERGVAEAGDAILRRQLEGDEVPAGTGDDDPGVGDPHAATAARVRSRRPAPACRPRRRSRG